MKTKQQQLILTVDVGATTSKFLLVRNGKIVGKLLEKETVAKKGPEYLASEIITGFNILMGKHKIHWEDVSGLGIALPAPVRDGVVQYESNLGNTDWNGADFRKIFLRAMSEETEGQWSGALSVTNDGRAGVRGVCEILGKKAKTGTVLYYAVGSGVGGAPMIDGVPVIGYEPGQTGIHYSIKSFLATPGLLEEQRLEDVVSLLAIARILPIYFRAGYIPIQHQIMLRGRLDENEDEIWLRRAKCVLGAASKYVTQSQFLDFTVKIMAMQADCFGRYIATQIYSFNPHTIVIGGGVVDPRFTSRKFRNWWMKLLRKAIEGNVTMPYLKRFKLVVSPIGDAASAYGVALEVREMLAD
jgi:predicted NBD/HSP70 family sugar kinase